MNRVLVILLSAAVISVTAISAASAGPRHRQYDRNAYVANDRFCLQGRIWGYPGNCQFATYEQCAVTASGTDAYCDVNPQYYFARQGNYR